MIASKLPYSWFAAAVGLALLATAPACDESDDSEASQPGPAAGSKSEETGGAGSSASAEDEEAESSESPDAESTATNDQEDPSTGPLKGRVQPGDVTEGFERWREAMGRTDVDSEAADALGEVDGGATIEVYFGSWCPDSRRELSDFWAALQKIEEVPFDVEYIALDKDFDAGDVSLEEIDIDYVPTFVVRRDGKEVGRVVESAPDGIARELTRLLTGEVEGTVSGRDNL